MTLVPFVIPAERSESGDLVPDLAQDPGSALRAVRDDETASLKDHPHGR
jgi:hypothetical protein